jgi:hypothetical protein
MIKNLITLLFVCSNLQTVVCQNISFELNDKLASTQYVAYVGVLNPINVIIENIPCTSVFLTSDNGPIIQDSLNNCQYNFAPRDLKFSKIQVWRLSGLDTILIESKKVYCKAIPFTAIFGDTGFGKSMSVEEISKLQLYVFSLNTGITATMDIISFHISITRDERLIYQHDYLDTQHFKFSNNELEILKSGDEIEFTDIKYNYMGLFELFAKPLFVKVK